MRCCVLYFPKIGLSLSSGLRQVQAYRGAALVLSGEGVLCANLGPAQLKHGRAWSVMRINYGSAWGVMRIMALGVEVETFWMVSRCCHGMRPISQAESSMGEAMAGKDKLALC